MLCYTAYCLWLLEKCIKFITKNAYIQVALTNTGLEVFVEPGQGRPAGWRSPS